MIKTKSSMTLSFGLIVSMVFFALPSLAQEIQLGEAVYVSTCSSCHGDAAQGNEALGAPSLAGQQEAYTLRQLRYFQSGIRSGGDFSATMTAIAATLGETDASNVAAYLSSLEPTKTAATEGDLRLGNNYYHGSCGGCHGGKAEGNTQLNAPRLAGLSIPYMKRQIQEFQTGVRGSHADDRYGRQMKMMSNVLPNEETMDAVLAFINAQAQ